MGGTAEAREKLGRSRRGKVQKAPGLTIDPIVVPEQADRIPQLGDRRFGHPPFCEGQRKLALPVVVSSATEGR